jgi:hypothetical protein
MSLALRLLASLSICGATIALAWPAVADPDIGKSADSVITQLQKEGYDVQVNGGPAGDVSLLTTCTVTSIHHPSTATTVDVAVACPLTHG